MNQRLTIVNEGDLYEVRFQGHVIISIIRFLNGSCLRQEMEYDSLPNVVKNKVLDKVSEILSNEN